MLSHCIENAPNILSEANIQKNIQDILKLHLNFTFYRKIFKKLVMIPRETEKILKNSVEHTLQHKNLYEYKSAN